MLRIVGRRNLRSAVRSLGEGTQGGRKSALFLRESSFDLQPDRAMLALSTAAARATVIRRRQHRLGIDKILQIESARKLVEP